METIKLGSNSKDTKRLQELLGITADGIFGSKTEEAVKEYQENHKLQVDGVVGPGTWATLLCIDPEVLYKPISTHITKLGGRKIEYLVIHFTAGSSSAAGKALATREVFISRSASADFIVDDRDIVQINPDLENYYCWAVGDSKKKSVSGGKFNGISRNKNSVSIEICSSCNPRTTAAVSYPNHTGWSFTNEALENAVKLAKIIMKTYNIPVENVIRHYDVTGKRCPGIIGWNDELIYDLSMGKMTTTYSTSEEWEKFKRWLVNL